MTKRRIPSPFAARAVCRLVLPTVAASWLLSAPAQADVANTPAIAPENDPNYLLWGDLPKTPNVASFKELAQIATTQISFLSALRSWRETFNGSGSQARRDLFNTKFGGEKLGLSLGNVAPPTLAGFGGNGLSAHWGNLEIGSTYRPVALDQVLLQWDQVMSGQKLTLADRQFVSWLRAQPFKSKAGALEITIARASRDMAAGEAVDLKDGTFMSGKGRLSLPLKWNASGEWNSAKIEAEETRRNWMAQADGPIQHPFGTAKAHIEWKQVDAGYKNLTNENIAGEQGGRADVTQDIKIGALTGQLQAGLAEKQRDDFSKSNPGDELARENAVGNAKLSYQFTKDVALRVQAGASSVETQLAAGEANSVADDINEQVKNVGADVGLEWKLNKGLSVTALVGQSAIETQRQTVGPDGTPTTEVLPGQEEQRFSLELKKQARKGQLGLRYTTRNRENTNSSAPAGPWMQVDSLRLEAGHQIGGLNIKTLLDFARDRDADWGDDNALAKHAEAQIQFSSSTRLDLHYRDGSAGAANWWNDPLSAQLSNYAGDNEYGIRFNTGSTAGAKGFGLSVEYARNQVAGTDNDFWKLGVTYK